MFCYLKAICCGCLTIIATVSFAQSALVQFIHNSPDITLPSVDLWINGELFAPSIDYLHATAMQPADTASNAQFELRNATDTSIIYLNWQESLTINSKNIFVLHGHLNPDLYSPGRELNVARFSQAIETSSSTSSIDIIFFQGATELDSADIEETQLFELTAFDQLAYGTFSSYLNLFTADYGWSILTSDENSSLGEYALPVTELNWAGKAITIVTGGFVNQSTNNNGQALGMWATTRDGGNLVPLHPLQWNLTANVQLLHNSSHPASESIRIQTDSLDWQANLQSHEATSFLPFPAGKEVIMSIHSNLLEPPLDLLWIDTLNLISGRNYQLIWYGGDAPENSAQLLIHPWEEINEPATNEFLLRLFNGSFPYSPLSLLADTISQTPIFNNVTYGSFSDTLTLTVANEEWIFYSGSDSLTAFHAPLDTLDLSQHIVTALTFAAQGEVLPQLWLSTEIGGPMHQLNTLIVPETPVFCEVQLVHVSADTGLYSIDVWMNDSLMASPLLFESATDFFDVQCNDPIEILITEHNHPENILHRDTIDLQGNQANRLILWGILDSPNYNPAPQLDWYIDANTPLTSTTNGNTDIRFFHAATDLGDVQANESSTPIVPFFITLGAGEMSNVQNLSSQNDYGLEILNSPTQFSYGNYELPVNTENWQNESVVVVSTGFRQPANNSSGEPLQFWVLESNGSMTLLETFVDVADTKSGEELVIFPNPASQFIRIQSTSQANGMVSLEILDNMGKLVIQKTSTIRIETLYNEVSLDNLPDGIYTLVLKKENYHQSARFCILKSVEH
jgi:hypothetical protein